MDMMYMMKLVGDLLGSSGFQDVVTANFLGSGCLQVTVSSRIDPLVSFSLQFFCNKNILPRAWASKVMTIWDKLFQDGLSIGCNDFDLFWEMKSSDSNVNANSAFEKHL